jgi:hypothetical protein
MENGGIYRSALKNLSINFIIDYNDHSFMNFIPSKDEFSYSISEKNVSAYIKMLTANLFDDTLYQYDYSINNFDNG